jgi:hypothetical protein
MQAQQQRRALRGGATTPQRKCRICYFVLNAHQPCTYAAAFHPIAAAGVPVRRLARRALVLKVRVCGA